MRRIFHRCVPVWDLCDVYIFTWLDLYNLQGMYDQQDMYDRQDRYDLPEWDLCDLHDLYILTGVRSVRFAGSVRSADFCMIWRICKSWIRHTCFSMFINSNNRSRKISNRVARSKLK